MNVRSDSPCILQEIFLFGSPAQKGGRAREPDCHYVPEYASGARRKLASPVVREGKKEGRTGERKEGRKEEKLEGRNAGKE